MVHSNLFVFVLICYSGCFWYGGSWRPGWRAWKAWTSRLTRVWEAGATGRSLIPCWQKKLTTYFTKTPVCVCVCDYLCYYQGLPGPAGGAKGEKVGFVFHFTQFPYLTLLFSMFTFFFLQAKQQRNQKPLETSKTAFFFSRPTPSL